MAEIYQIHHISVKQITCNNEIVLLDMYIYGALQIQKAGSNRCAHN